LTGTAGTTPGVNFIGTTDNKPLELRANNMMALKLTPSQWGASVVIGGLFSSTILTIFLLPVLYDWLLGEKQSALVLDGVSLRE